MASCVADVESATLWCSSLADAPVRLLCLQKLYLVLECSVAADWLPMSCASHVLQFGLIAECAPVHHLQALLDFVYVELELRLWWC